MKNKKTYDFYFKKYQEEGYSESSAERKALEKAQEKRIIKIASIAGVVVIGLIITALSMYTVDTGSVAVIKTFGKVTEIKQEGLHFKVPIIQTKQKMTVREQTIKFGREEEFPALSVSTKDMQTVEIELTVSDITHDPMKLYQSFTGNHVSSLLLPRVRDAVQSNVSKYSIEEFVAKRNVLAQDIFDELKKELEPYGLTLTNVSIVNHDFSDAYEQAVENKKVAEQAVETEKAIQNKKIIEAEKSIELAELEIEKKKLLAEANKIETESLSDAILYKMWLEKWDGKLPQVTSDKSTIMMPFDK